MLPFALRSRGFRKAGRMEEEWDERGHLHGVAKGFEARIVDFNGEGRGGIDDCDAYRA